MEPLIELCDLIAQNPAKLMGKLAWICDRCPVAEILLIVSPKVSTSELNAILAVARFLSKCPNHSDEMPKSLVLVFYRSIPSSLNRAFWPQSFTNDSIGYFFCNFFEYICKACEFSPEFSADVSGFTADILISVIGNVNADRGISKAILKAMSYNCPPVVPSDANKLVSGLLEMIIRLPEGNLRTSSHTSSTAGNVDLSGGSSGYNDTEKHAIASFEEEPVDILEKREMTLKLIGNVLNKVPIDANLLENVRGTVKRQLQLMVAFLKIRKRDWSEQGKSLKVKINAIFAADQAATRLHINTLASLELAGKSSERLLHEALPLLIEAAEACLFSVWRKLRACEELFSTLVSGICHVAVVRDGQMLQLLLNWFKHLVLSTCARANTWGSNQGATFENVFSTSCEINLFRLDNAHSRLYTFITSSLERNCSEEEVEKQKQAAPSLLLNSLMLLADLNVSVKRPEAVDMVLPFFVDSLEEGDASLPGLLRLRLLDAVARMASLGFEKSYREAIVLMTKSYLSSLGTVGSVESETIAPEAITERVETLPAGFLLIARDLTTPKLRTDYRHSLLSLCSEVGLVAESKSGKSGADFLGPLLPAVAEICSDSDPTIDVEPSLLKLFRNLWFYVALYGLAPPLQNPHGMTKSVSSTTLNSVCSMGSVVLQAVSGPYMWSADWSSAVQRISQGTPPLVMSSMKWLEDELELNALHNPGSSCGSDNEEAASSQRGALSAALGGSVEVSAMSTISGVRSTYLLAVAFLEIIRFSSNGGILNVPSPPAFRSAFSCVFEYLKSPGLKPAVSQCLTALVHRVFEAAVAWLEDQKSETGPQAEYRESTLSTHASFLIKNLSQMDEHIQYISVNLLNQLRDCFPQILWSSSCLDSLLFSVHNDLPSSVVNDPICVATKRLLYQRIVREWIIVSLSQAPCTTLGLLQEKLCKANTWQKLQPEAEVFSLLSEINIGTCKKDCYTRTKTANIPAVMAAAAAASGAKLKLTEGFNLEVLSTGILGATAKCNHAGEIAGLRRLYESIGSLDLPALAPVDMVGNLQLRSESFPSVILTMFIQLLQKFVNYAKRGGELDMSSFHETCSLATALLLSDLGSESNIEIFTQLVRLLCWCPAYILTPDAIETGVFIWTWLISAAPQLCSLVLAELVDAWLWTVDTKRGVFASEVRCCGTATKLRPHLVPGEPEEPPEKDPFEQIMAHKVWLGFFIDRFEVVRHDSVVQLLLLGRLLQGTIQLPWNFSSHPAATGTFFTLMLFGLKFCSCKSLGILQNLRAGLQLLEDRIYRVALGWFAHQPEWYDINKNFSLSEAWSVSMFVNHLLNEQLDATQLYSQGRGLENQNYLNDVKDQFHPVWGQMDSYTVGREKRKQLLLMLCEHEADRLYVWAQPSAKECNPCLKISSDKWVDFARTAFSVDPCISFCLVARFPANNHLKAEVTQLVQSHILEIRHIPEALPYFVTRKAIDEKSALLEQLPHWAACSITQALEFLTQAYKGHQRVMAYVLSVLESYPPQSITFFIPQLVQALRSDDKQFVEEYLLRAAQRSDIFAHILIWNLQGENCEPESGKGSSAEHAAFLAHLPLVRQRIIDGFNEKARNEFQREFDFFDEVTSISDALSVLHQEECKAGFQRELEKIEMQGDDLYLPIAPNKIVKGIQVDSGIPLQSAAKVPVIITFNVADRDGDQNDIKSQDCIFKVGDCRQDVLSLQVISLLKDIFEAVGLNLYLYPYGVLPTSPERGIIEVVPNSRSRSQIAEMNDGGLYEIFQQDFGPVGSPGFEAARENFIISSAGYAVTSLLLQPDDRHYGNLLIDSAGRLVHIDFGSILKISPGANMQFAHFKLSHEMTQLIDPSGAMKSETWDQFVSLCVKGYLAARCYMDGIINTVSMMLDSGLPCFSRGDPIGDLRKRFHPEMSEREAANYMIRACSDAYK